MALETKREAAASFLTREVDRARNQVPF